MLMVDGGLTDSNANWACRIASSGSYLDTENLPQHRGLPFRLQFRVPLLEGDPAFKMKLILMKNAKKKT